MIGLAQGAFDYTMPYLKSRKQFGTSIADFQMMEYQYSNAATGMFLNYFSIIL